MGHFLALLLFFLLFACGPVGMVIGLILIILFLCMITESWWILFPIKQEASQEERKEICVAHHRERCGRSYIGLCRMDAQGLCSVGQSRMHRCQCSHKRFNIIVATVIVGLERGQRGESGKVVWSKFG